ncbi:attachment p12 family protein [Roseimicrobium gellanilyticum]|uniref:Attachment p12 family protein n=1 Tax=Roseimicrobium gellanilyticum TaxID=748857 RepID=A0A366HA56_9BACT|nr:FeoB-associated Cys-rich membrane protein [Roseimicrobium gellanilyticum]RBP39150.1 attachment p12 family protein [Roseimicrobium gellanilyticum]
MNASNDWQSWAALLVVIGTVIVFVKRTFWKKKRAGGCASCGSGPSKPVTSSRISPR